MLKNLYYINLCENGPNVGCCDVGKYKYYLLL